MLTQSPYLRPPLSSPLTDVLTHHSLDALDMQLIQCQRRLQSLRKLEPRSGVQALDAGQQVQHIYQAIVAWGLLLMDEPLVSLDSDWDTFIRHYQYKNSGLQTLQTLHYPVQLRSYLRRHTLLQAQKSGSNIQNGDALKQLIEPLEYALEAVRSEHTAWMKQQPVFQKKRRRLWLSLSGLAALFILVGSVHAYWNIRPQKAQVQSLPKAANKGGITGIDYPARWSFRTLQTHISPQLTPRWTRRRSKRTRVLRTEWTGWLQASRTGRHTLCVAYNGKMTIYVGKKSILDDWTLGHTRKMCTTLALQKGWHTFQMLQEGKQDKTYSALLWKTPQNPKMHLIPAQNLCCKKSNARKK